MGKDPAFLFYPNDWLGGTLGMTFEEKGAYLELLMLQFNRGHMTFHMISQTVGQLWDKVKDKFVVDSEGKYYNVRLETEINKRKSYCASRRNNLKGNNQYTKEEGEVGHMTSHMCGHMENENVNEHIKQGNKRGVGEKKAFKPPTIEEIQTYCQSRQNSVDVKKFFEYYDSSGWVDSKGQKVRNWKQKMISWEKNNGQERTFSSAEARNKNPYFEIAKSLEVKNE